MKTYLSTLIILLASLLVGCNESPTAATYSEPVSQDVVQSSSSVEGVLSNVDVLRPRYLRHPLIQIRLSMSLSSDMYQLDTTLMQLQGQFNSSVHPNE